MNSLNLDFALQQISKNYLLSAGVALNNYLFNLCALEKLDITYESSYNLQDNKLLEKEVPLNPDLKLQLKLKQGDLFLLQIISGLEVSLLQSYFVINVIKQIFTKEMTIKDIQAIEKECLKKPWAQLWSSKGKKDKDILGIQDFFDKISDTAASSYINEIFRHANNLYKCRNALLHRGRIVAQQDILQGQEYLEISYRKKEFYSMGIESDDLRLLQIGSYRAEESPVVMKHITLVARQFKVDEQIKFETDDDFIHIYLTFLDFVGFLESCIRLILSFINWFQSLVKNNFS